MSKEQYYLKLLEKQKEFTEKDKKCIDRLLKENAELKDLVKRQVCQAECYRYKQLLTEQAKNKLEFERNKSFENVRQLLYSEIKKLSNPNRNFDGIDEMVQQNIELQAKNKKLVEALENIIIIEKWGQGVEIAKQVLEVNNAK